MKKPNYRRVFDCEVKAATADKYWLETVEHVGKMNAARAKLVDQYVRELTEYEHLYPIVSTVGAVKIGKEGGEYFNYQWSALNKIKDRLLKLQDALLITPRSNTTSTKEKPNLDKPKTPADVYLLGGRQNH